MRKEWSVWSVGVLLALVGCANIGGPRDAGAGDVADMRAPQTDAGEVGDVLSPDGGIDAAVDVCDVLEPPPDSGLDVPVDQPMPEPDALSDDIGGTGGAGGSGADANVPLVCTTSAPSRPPPPSPCSGVVGDFDGDGIVDCAQLVQQAGTALQTIVFYKGLTAGGYATSGVTTADPVGSLYSNTLQQVFMTFDLNHDGRMDIITTGPDTANAGSFYDVFLLGGRADGTFTVGSTVASGIVGRGQALPGDYDGDGFADLLVAGYDSLLGVPRGPRWIVLRGSANGGLEARETGSIIPPDFPGSLINKAFASGLVAADLNKDGKVDVVGSLATYPSVAANLIVSLNTGGGIFTTSLIQGSQGAGSTFVRDINGDGNVDVETVLPAGLVPFFGDGAGHFTAGPPEDVAPDCPQLSPSLTPQGDCDGDGIPDCVFFQPGQRAGSVDVVFRKGTGGGRYRVAQVVTQGVPLDPSYKPYAAVDLNNDGRAELLVGGQAVPAWQLQTVVLSGNADGTFTAASPASFNFFPSAMGLQRSYVADFDGDGRKDVFTAGLQGLTASAPVCLGTISMKEASAAPSFQESCTPIVGAGVEYAVATADVNNDGKLDVVLVIDTVGNYRLVVALGDGTGKFTLAPSSIPDGIAATDGASDAVPVDCNGDGKIDLVVTFGNAMPARAPVIFYGDGAGGFVPHDAPVVDAGAPADGPAADAVAEPDGAPSSDAGLGDRSPDSSTDPSCAGSGVTLTTDKSSYKDTDRTISVSFSGLRGINDDVLTLALITAGTFIPRQDYTPNQFSGHTTFISTEVGTYVIRYSSRSTGALFCQTAPFTIFTPATSVSTDKSTYMSGQVVGVQFVNLPNTGLNYLQLAVAGSAFNPNLGPSTSTNAVNGTYSFYVVLAPGEYVVRAIAQPAVLLAESTPFTITPASSTAPTITTDKATYAINETITVTYAGLPGNALDEIRLAMATDDDAQFRAEVLTNGRTSGTVTFTTAVVGSYVVRAHVNDTTNVVARSAVFTVAN